MGDWPNAEAADALLDLAKTDPENKYRVRALRGYIRIARQLQLPDDAKLAMFRTAMETAKRDEDKQLALDILTRIPSAETLKLAVSYVDEAGLKDAAADAAVKIATKLVGQQPKASPRRCRRSSTPKSAATPAAAPSNYSTRRAAVKVIVAWRPRRAGSPNGDSEHWGTHGAGGSPCVYGPRSADESRPHAFEG